MLAIGVLKTRLPDFALIPSHLLLCCCCVVYVGVVVCVLAGVSQDTALALWIPSVVLAMVEVGLSVWCFSVGLTLRGLAPCGNHYIKEQVGVGRWFMSASVEAVLSVSILHVATHLSCVRLPCKESDCLLHLSVCVPSLFFIYLTVGGGGSVQ